MKRNSEVVREIEVNPEKGKLDPDADINDFKKIIEDFENENIDAYHAMIGIWFGGFATEDPKSGKWEFLPEITDEMRAKFYEIVKINEEDFRADCERYGAPLFVKIRYALDDLKHKISGFFK